MKSRPNNLAKTLLRTKSPPPPTKQEMANSKNIERNIIQSQPQLNRFSSSDSKQKKGNENVERKAEKRGGKVEEDDNTTEQSSSQHIEYVAGEYQLEGYDVFKRKNVQFEDRPTELQGRVSAGKGSSRNSSILKNATRVLDRSALSSDKSLSVSVQNSFTVRSKCKLTLPAPDAANLATRKKYDSLIQQLGRQGEKYIDDFFPPVEASLYATSVHKKVNLAKSQEDIVWLRIPEVFPQNKLSVYSKVNTSQGSIVAGGMSAEYIAECFNAVASCPELLSSIFESECINQHGIYLVKIYQEHNWRYVIVDDLIPCLKRKAKMRREEKYSPAFINIAQTAGEPVCIWPFLLEKAYANYYNCYENLNFGNTLDFLAEITGTSYSQLPLFSKKNGKVDFSRVLTRLTRHVVEGSPLLGLLIEGKEGKDQYVPLAASDSFTDNLWTFRDPNSGDTRRVEGEQLSSFFSSLYLYPRSEYPHTTTCPVYPPKVLKPRQSKLPKGKYMQIPPNDTISVRGFTLFKRAKVRVQVRQKQNRFYYQCGITQYLWVRCIFLQKQYDGGFRWLAGKYASQKHIIFEEALQPGEYILIVMVEWREKHNRELTVLLASDCQFLKLQRRNYLRQERVIELACMDLAQRFGKLSQINKSICAYTYLCEQSALIIENIINQRTKGDVTIMRSISGLRSKAEILPLNPEFEVEPPEEYAGLEKQEGRRVIDQSIEIDISKGEAYTVVLRMRGGIDKKFFKVFNFG